MADQAPAVPHAYGQRFYRADIHLSHPAQETVHAAFPDKGFVIVRSATAFLADLLSSCGLRQWVFHLLLRPIETDHPVRP